ncbi:PLDc N-terminal domain-containing protein [Algoriphagus vanfongensis]|uniref:PLDc N-terminal domain-containing protein n=1 Tax=Algoriphagus vanfongensis TaxID=426371 RepID=UPI000A0053DD|nr:PLD nuclease N-terminal domain-containing protein [Algoriphagus vanfongensis]
MMNYLNFIQNMGGGSIIVLFLIGILYFGLWLYCIVDVIRSDFRDPNMKLIWILILIFVQFIGSIIYLAVGKTTKATII